jgi:hypothetical protein
MQSTQPSQKGCALGCSILITIFLIVPYMIYSRAKHDVQEAVMTTQVQDKAVEFVVLYEENWRGPKPKLGDAVAHADGADLRSVAGKLPSPFSTPRYAWVYPDIPPTLVYGVFDSVDAAKAWMKREGYTGEDKPFKLEYLKQDQPSVSEGKGIAWADVPRWSKDTREPVRRQMGIAIFTSKYNIWNGEVFARTDPEIYNVYRQLPKEN